MSKCDFNKVAKHSCSPVNLLDIFRKPFPKNTSGQNTEGLLLAHSYTRLLPLSNQYNCLFTTLLQFLAIKKFIVTTVFNTRL